MATDVEKLIVRLEATQAKFERQLAGANRTADRRARAIEQRFARMNASVSRSMAGMLAPLAAGVSLAGAKNLIDTATRIDNALKVAGLSGKELESVYQALFDSAQRNAAPLETLVTLYSRATLVQNELGVSTQELLNFTDKVALALRLSGQSASESAGALLQLSQALGNGIVQAEEYNSLIDSAPLILRAVAAGLEEAGGSVAKLTRLVKSQQVSSQAFFRAFEAGSYVLEDKVAGATDTVSQAVQQLENALVDAARRFNDSTHVTETFADAITGTLIPAINELGGVFNGLGDGPIANFIGWVNQAKDAVLQMSADIGAATGLDQVGKSFGAKPYIGQGRIQDRIDGAFAGTGLNASVDKGPTDVGTIKKPGSVSIKQYPAVSKSGGGGRSRRSPADRFQSDVEQIKARTEAINAETAALAGLNPLIDDYGYAVQKAGAEQDLLNAAKRAGLNITPELKASIEQLATSYAQASADAEQLRYSQDKVRETAQEFADLGKDVLGGFIRDMRDGKSASEALSAALGKISDKLLDIALNSIFDSKGGLLSGLFGGGMGRGGLLGGAIIPGILHSGGVAGRDGYGHGRAVPPSVFAGAQRYHAGGIAGLRPGEIPAILQRGEVVIPKGARAASGGTVINMPVNIDARNADAAGLARVQTELQNLKRSVPKMVDQRVDVRQTRKTRP